MGLPGLPSRDGYAAAKRPTVTAIDAEPSLVISYLTLRKAVGLLGVAFPLVLSIGCRLCGSCDGIQPSISEYYGTEMRDVFVGLLFAIGLFLFSYRGYEPKDNLAGNLACAFAVGVALFPVTATIVWIRRSHYVFAAALFLTLAYFSLFLFTKTREDVPPTLEKRKRNKVYVVCGTAILVWIALIPLYELFLTQTPLARLEPVFWLESLALWSFGISWIVKGEAILKDRS
jgi:hypothetical protein